MKSTSTKFFPAALLCVPLLTAVLPSLGAATYSITINTSAWSGQTGSLAFDLTGGDAVFSNNVASISGLSSNGTLANASAFVLTDGGFFNEILRDITFGTFLNFSLQLTENNAAPGVDQFSFFLLNPGLLPIGGTTDPTTADALFAIDITGAGGGSLAVFSSLVPNTSWQVTAVKSTTVPDTGNTFSLLLLGAAVLGASRFAISSCRQ